MRVLGSFQSKVWITVASLQLQHMYTGSVIYLLLPMLMKAALVVDPVMVSTSGDTLSGPFTLAKYRYIINLHFVMYAFMSS